MNHFSIEIIFGQHLQTFGDFYLVTLESSEAQDETNKKLKKLVLRNVEKEKEEKRRFTILCGL